MALTMPTRELVGLLADVYPFASQDDDDTTWNRVVLRWDGTRLHAMAGSGSGPSARLAWMSWGPDDGDQPALPLDFTGAADASWELAILPQDAKEIATKFKVNATAGETPLVVDGDADRIRVVRHADTGLVALTGAASSRPWDDNGVDIAEAIAERAEAAKSAPPVKVTAYYGAALVDFVNPKVVRQRGPVVMHPGRGATYIEIGRWFRGAVVQTNDHENDHG